MQKRFGMAPVTNGAIPGRKKAASPLKDLFPKGILGHTPFGHTGERVLNELMDGGFLHFQQSLRVVDKLENNGNHLVTRIPL